MSDRVERVRLSQLRARVGWSFFAIAFVGRLPVAMNVVGVLTMVALVRGSLADAGLASATLGVASGVGGPLLGAAADRWGQRWVLTAAAVANSAALAGVVAAVYAGAPLPVLVASCLVVGATSPQISPLTRARWLALLAHEPGRPDSQARTAAAMSYEGMADELSFVCGPVLVGVLATAAGPAAPVVAAAVLTVVFVIAFAWHRTAAAVRPTPRLAAAARHESRHSTRLPLRVLVPVGGMLFMGAFFGSSLVSLTQFMRAADAEPQTGLVYGALGVTSALGALAIGRVPPSIPLGVRWLAGALVLLGAALVLPFVTAIPAMVALLLVFGAAAGPILVTMFSVGAESAPPRRIATTMTLLSSGITVGQALATAGTSAVAEAGGFTASAVVVIVLAFGAVVLASADLIVMHRPGRTAAQPEDIDHPPTEAIGGSS